MKLYGIPPTRATRAVWLIQELGLECEVVHVSILKGEHRTPEFLAINPAGRLPALVDGDLVLTESVAIALYLAEKHAEKGLIPNELRERAEMYRWLFFVVTEIEGPLERIARHTLLYDDDKKLPQDVKAARQEARRMLALLEQHMQGRSYLLGERVSVADMVTAYTLDWAREEGLLEEAPRLQEYLTEMYRRPNAAPTIRQAYAALKAAQG
jgi:glutathione S-transferase